MKESEEANSKEQQKIELTREQLYELVWSKPATKLAKELGISDVAIAKICKKMNIPKPFPGYWKLVAVGRSIKLPLLPELPKAESNKIVIQRKPSPPEQKDSEILERLRAERSPENRIVAGHDLRDPHPLVGQVKDVLKKTTADQYKRLIKPYAQPCLDVRVSQGSIHRTLCIMDALLKALETRGYTVEVSNEGTRPTNVLVKDDKVRIYIIENVERIERELTPEERKKSPSIIFDRWVYRPTGALALVIDEYLSRGDRKKWTDGSRKRLEEQLNEVIVGIIAAGETVKQQRLQREKRELEWREKELRCQKERELRENEEQRRQAFDEHVHLWRKSQETRSFIRDCEKRIRQRRDSIGADSPEAKWLQWAHSYLDILENSQDDYLKKATEQFNKGNINP